MAINWFQGIIFVVVLAGVVWARSRMSRKQKPARDQTDYWRKR